MPLKESKGNSIYNTTFSPELERAFQMYLLVRRNNFGEMPEEQIQALREDLITLRIDIRIAGQACDCQEGYRERMEELLSVKTEPG